MMQSMRDNMKVIIWATAIIFLVGFGVLQLGGVLNPPSAGGPAGVIAKINGEPIRYEEFMGMYQNILNQVRASRELREGEDSYIREQAWQQMVQAKLMGQEVRRRGITASPEEIKIAIRFAPPDFVVQAPGFQTGGRFDYKKYIAELENPNSQVPWSQIEAYVAASLPQQKLQEQIVLGAKVSEADVRDRFMLIHDKLKARYLYFPADSFPVDTTRIGGADIETYYRSHPEEFTGPPEVKLQVAIIPRRPKGADFTAGRERMLGIREQILAQPDSFPKYARTYSEINSAAGGGDAPDIPFLNLRPLFQVAIKTIEPGQLTDVVKEERSIHLFRLDKRWLDPKSKQVMVHYHEIAFRVEPGAETIRDIRKSVQAILADARKSGLSRAAARAGVATTDSPYFREGNSRNETFDRFPELERWTFTAKVGSVSHPVPTESAWYLYEIADRQPAGLRPLSQARIFARERLIHSLQLAGATDAATHARAAILGGMNEAEAAKRFHGVVDTTPEVTRSGNLGNVGNEPRIVGGLFGTPQGTWSQPLTGSSAALIGIVEEHTRPTEEEFRKLAVETRNTILNERRQTRFTEWIQAVRKKAKIEDYRENFFEA
jgi:hypothetical protein